MNATAAEIGYLFPMKESSRAILPIMPIPASCFPSFALVSDSDGADRQYDPSSSYCVAPWGSAGT